MKLIRNKKLFVIGVFCIIFFPALLIFSIFNNEYRSSFFYLLMILSGITNIINSISTGFLGEKIEGVLADERDTHITLKCSIIASKVMYYCVIIIAFVFGMLFYFLENIGFVFIAISLLIPMLIYSVSYLVSYIYQEKRG